MSINESKCHNITFNFSQKNYYPQNLTLNGKIINTENKIKLLGVNITNDLKWTENTKEICSKINRKLYILSKLKHHGLQSRELITVWISVIRPISEYTAPLWHSGLSDKATKKLEMLQKTVLAIILGTVYVNNRKHYKVDKKPHTYIETLQLVGLTTLQSRRETLTRKFAINTLASANHSSMLVKNDSKYMNTRNRLVFKEPFCNTDRYYNSAMPYMIRLLNKMYLNPEKT